MKLKVLLLPSNIASMPAITLDRLNQAGCDARGIFIDSNIYQDYGNAKTYQLKGLKFGIFQKILNFCTFYYNAVKAIYWADVIHWSGGFGELLMKSLLPWIKILKKPSYVEWVGSDIRIPEIEFKDNPYYTSVFNKGYEYSYESYSHSRLIQKRFKWAGFTPLVFPGMEQYILTDIFPKYTNFIQRIDVTNYVPRFPDINNERPRIIHAPSAPFAKGTHYIEEAIQDLGKELDFDYVRVHKMSRITAIQNISSCDIFVDQLVLGSYGMATMEAFAMGKPVVCFMKDSVINCFPQGLPIVNANPDNIGQVLRDLITNPLLRNQLGRKSRAYVSTHHDIDKCVIRLISLYKEIKKKQSIS